MVAPKPRGVLFHAGFLKQVGIAHAAYTLQALAALLVINLEGQGNFMSLTVSLCLAFIPAILLLLHVLSIHLRSTTRRQAFITFIETTLFVLGLMLLILGPIDSLLGRALSEEHTFECKGIEGSASAFVDALNRSIYCDPAKDQAVTACHEEFQGMPVFRLHGYYETIDGLPSLPAEAIQSLGKDMKCEALDDAASRAFGNMRVRPFTGENWSVDLLRYRPGDEHVFRNDGPIVVTFQMDREMVGCYVLMGLFWAMFEEFLKFFIIRRIIFKDRVADPAGVLVYSLTVGCSFAAVENVQRSTSFVPFFADRPALAAEVLALPLHCTTAAMIGIVLGYRKLLGRAFNIPGVMIVPVVLHSFIDVILFEPSDSIMERAIAIAFILAGEVYVRFGYMQLDNVNDVNVREMQDKGKISPPSLCCIESGMCIWLRKEDDPVAAEARRIEQQAAFFAAREMGKAPPSPAVVTFRTMWRVFWANLTPPSPPCETQDEVACKHCSRPTRSHVNYPSTCAYCGLAGADPILEHGSSTNALATGIGY
eukprot:TRINITY_DN42810_c0_g1_i1.p1 TRINITY_DN42810_c0_g1~~TRINITY_DN42810_c0_g1_i1.p1  ORF type:complete len:559 (-),score=96.25 TRINITY_DN42810_c0_g1_i1:78-1688(-)